MHEPGVIARDEIDQIIDRSFHITGPVEGGISSGAVDDDPGALVIEDVWVVRHRLDDFGPDRESAVFPVESQQQVCDHAEWRWKRADNPLLRREKSRVGEGARRGELPERWSERLGGIDDEHLSLRCGRYISERERGHQCCEENREAELAERYRSESSTEDAG